MWLRRVQSIGGMRLKSRVTMRGVDLFRLDPIALSLGAGSVVFYAGIVVAAGGAAPIGLIFWDSLDNSFCELRVAYLGAATLILLGSTLRARPHRISIYLSGMALLLLSFLGVLGQSDDWAFTLVTSVPFFGVTVAAITAVLRRETKRREMDMPGHGFDVVVHDKDTRR